MFAKDILVGQSYRVTGAYGRGRAVVMDHGRKDRWSKKFVFHVQFPDARPGSKNTEADITSRDFKRLWTMEDQQEFEAERREGAEIDVLETALTAAGFKPDVVRNMGHRGTSVLYLAFRGDTAEQVIETLVQSVREEEPQRRLSTREAHEHLDHGH